jgi:hypothetical protein
VAAMSVHDAQARKMVRRGFIRSPCTRVTAPA